jgi:diguanylate cyclase (GGDEF)-like protein
MFVQECRTFRGETGRFMANLSQALATKTTRDSQRLLGSERSELAGRVFYDGWRGVGVSLGGVSLIALLGLLDFVTGPEFSFAILYLIPIALGAWWGGFAQGILLAALGAVSWQFVEVAEGANIRPAVQIWNGTARFGIFVFTSSLLSRLRLSLFIEKRMARSDPLTGAANGRTFYESVSLAVEAALRTEKPVTLAYLDLDQFKWINDNLGHAAGDGVLCELAQVIQRNVRANDVLARLGGDEFALLLVDCNEDDARIILERIRERFAYEMAQHKWPVTLSIGAVTFPRPGRDVDAMVRQVDELMYRAKKSGKNRIAHESRDPDQAHSTKLIERRATARVLCDRIARVRGHDDESLDEFARVRDISSSGLCLFLERKLAEDTLLAIEPLHECGAVTLVVRVLWAVEENGGWLHECVLPNRLTSDEMQFWIQEQAAESCHD